MEMVKALAGSRSQSIVPNALECSICQELMFYPYSIGCGHTFCGSCLKHWFITRQENNTEKTCPTCRDAVRFPPVMVHVVRELVNNVYDAIKGNNSTAASQILEHAAPDPGPEPFKDLYFLNPLTDRDDDVIRCQHCMWEVRDGFCEGCGRPQGQQNSDFSEVEEMSDMVSDEGTPDEDDDAFINDGEIEYESDPDAISNISRRRQVSDGDDDDDEEDKDDNNESSGNESTSSLEIIEPPAASNNRIITIGSSDEDESQDSSQSAGDYDDSDEASDIGQEHMPIVLSSSSDVMSDDYESEAEF